MKDDARIAGLETQVGEMWTQLMSFGESQRRIETAVTQLVAEKNAMKSAPMQEWVLRGLFAILGFVGGGAGGSAIMSGLGSETVVIERTPEPASSAGSQIRKENYHE